MHNPLDILVFAAHPDDAELFSGGALILATDKGLRVAVADLSAGELSSRGTPELRQQEIKVASQLLGLTDRLCVGLPDGQIGSDPAHREPIIQLIRQSKPRIVLAPYWHDRHPDHEAASKLVKEACFFAGVSKIGHGEPHRPQALYYYMSHYPFSPSFVVDISSVWERKIAAVIAYKSQFQYDGRGVETALSRPDFMRFIEARAIYFGAMIGAAYGEAFYTPAPLPLFDFPPPTGQLSSRGQVPAYRIY